MYAFANENTPVADYERSALVKEYVWRTKGGEDPEFGTNTLSWTCRLSRTLFIDDREFQLVTLATDRTAKLEYINPSVLEVNFAILNSSVTLLMHHSKTTGWVRGSSIEVWILI